MLSPTGAAEIRRSSEVQAGYGRGALNMQLSTPVVFAAYLFQHPYQVVWRALEKPVAKAT